MNVLGLFFIFIASSVPFSSCQDHGVQMRLTEKGMNYAVDMGIEIMKKDLKKIVINQNGSKSGFDFELVNLKIGHLDFGKYELETVQGTGMKGNVSGINIEAGGVLKIKYGGFFGFSDKTRLKVKASEINFEMTVQIGADSRGRPTIGVKKCSGSVKDIDLDFSGGMSFLYNLFSPIMESEMKITFQELLCSMAVKEINTKAKKELATFPVVKKIDDYAEIDYRLTSSPKFTNEYMDAFLKGEFKEAKDPKKKDLTMPSFSTNSDHKKMVYFWVTDYTINSAGSVYHNAGKLQLNVNGWDKEVPDEIKSILYTTKFAVLFPKLLLEYPNEEMGVKVKSYKAPTTKITSKEIHFQLFVLATFSVKTKELFTLKFDVKAGGEMSVRKTNITGEIVEFNYDGSVIKSSVGNPTVSLDNTFVRDLLDVLVIKNGNVFLQTGFPLPKVDEVTFRNFKVELTKDAIRVGTDLEYVNLKV